jgi:hypothetical protein
MAAMLAPVMSSISRKGVEMKKGLINFTCAALVGASLALGAGAAAAQSKKNWTPPAHKLYGQQLCDEVMGKHPELLSITLHGVPPGLEKVYTMFAGSFPERVGNADDPDDIDVIVKGITILDPRWRRTNDNPKKFVVLMPMRDAAGENVGLVVYAFKEPASNPNASAVEKDYFAKAATLRDELAKKTPSYRQLFETVKH